RLRPRPGHATAEDARGLPAAARQSPAVVARPPHPPQHASLPAAPNQRGDRRRPEGRRRPAGPAARLTRPGPRGDAMTKTIAEKIWDQHVVVAGEGEPDLLYVDLHLVHEVTSPQAFESLRLANRPVRRPDLTIATMDHDNPTRGGVEAAEEISRKQMSTLEENCTWAGIRLYGLGSRHQGIVHVIGPELGVTQAGMLIVLGDSHTSTHGAFGTLAFGIGSSEVEHVLATQTLVQRRPKDMA